ncbi:MAG: dihydropteroate synthase [Pseudomonadales bacterium]
MGVLNVTPDSFSDGGRFRAAAGSGGVDLAQVVDVALEMIAAGADVLDVGGESTRPGAEPVSALEECRRVIPVIERLRQLDIMVSVDTRKAEVARQAVAAGAHLVNDVSGVRDDGMLAVLAACDAGLCIMHMQGEPGTMQDNPRYRDVVAEVRAFLAQQVVRCRAAGIGADRLLLDPGFGFGKTLAHNLALLRDLEAVRVDGLPLLAGLSRKRMIGAITGRATGDRVVGSAVAALLAVQHGADVVRVHDVPATADALKMQAALAGQPAP